MPPIVQVEGLRKVFRAKEKAPGLGGSLRSLVRPEYREVEAVRGIAFALEAGEVVAFIGPNGAGKSTTIKMLTGILHPTSGQAQVLGYVPWRQRQELAFQIAAVFGQRSQLWYHLPPLDSFELLARIYELDPAGYRRRLATLVERFEIERFLRTPVRKLSLGERMRCEIAGSLLHRPRVLFLDEPTIGLDVVAKQRIRAHVRELSADEGTTVFLTSHDAGDVEQVCQRAIVINHGTVIFDDTVAALKRQLIPTKLIELKLTDPHPTLSQGEEAPPPPLPLGEGWGEGVSLVSADEYALAIEVDTTVQPIEAVIARIVASFRVADITISDPPLEEIIAAIYGARGRPPHAPDGPQRPAPGMDERGCSSDGTNGVGRSSDPPDEPGQSSHPKDGQGYPSGQAAGQGCPAHNVACSRRAEHANGGGACARSSSTAPS